MNDEIAAQIITGAFTLAAGAAGWWLTLASDWIARRRARREALGIVLTCLLEVRHRVVALRAVGALSEGFPSNHRSTWLRTIEHLEDFLPDLGVLSQGYDEALAILSRESPVLAFQLRFKDQVVGRVSELRRMFEQTGEGVPSDATVHAVSRLFGSLTTESLDATIKTVALGHGLTTRLRVGASLKSDAEHRAELEAFFGRYVDELVRTFPTDEAEIRRTFAQLTAPEGTRVAGT